MNRLIWFVLVVVGALGFVSLLPHQGQAAKDEKKAYKMVADLYVIMEYADDLIYKTIPEKIKAGKVAKVKDDAMVIAEMMNVSVHSEDYGKEEGWSDSLTKMKAQLVELSKAAKAKDKEKVMSLHKKAEETCDACHEKFRD